MIPAAGEHTAFGIQRTAIVKPIRENLSYGMLYAPRDMVGPNVPPPIPRQSLAQRILIKRHQASVYISKLTAIMSPLLELDYPYVHALTMIRTSPEPNWTPKATPYGANSVGGTMRPPGRFTKALPYPIAPYSPPTY